MARQLTEAEKTKLMIIENFIDHFTSDNVVRTNMKNRAVNYVEEDHVDEIEQAGFIHRNTF